MKILKSAKTNAAKDAYYYLASLPAEIWRSSKWRCPIRARSPRFAITCKSGGRCAWRRRLGNSMPWEWNVARNSTRSLSNFLNCNCAARAKTPEDRTKILQESRWNQGRSQKAREEGEKAQGRARSRAARGSKSDTRNPRHRQAGSKGASAPAGDGKSAPAGKTSGAAAKPGQSAAAAIGAKAQAKHDKAEHDDNAARSRKKSKSSHEEKITPLAAGGTARDRRLRSVDCCYAER